VAEVIRKPGISEQTFYRWKAKYAGLEVDRVRQMAQLQEENLAMPPSQGAELSVGFEVMVSNSGRTLIKRIAAPDLEIRGRNHRKTTSGFDCSPRSLLLEISTH
jgi:Transposase